jgi:hypothetical protein
MNRTQIYFPKSQLEALRRVAREKRITVSEVVREFTHKQLQDFAPQRKTEKNGFDSLLQSAERISKMGVKGPKDLARNMDKYLYGKDFR